MLSKIKTTIDILFYVIVLLVFLNKKFGIPFGWWLDKKGNPNNNRDWNQYNLVTTMICLGISMPGFQMLYFNTWIFDIIFGWAWIGLSVVTVTLNIIVWKRKCFFGKIRIQRY